MMDRGQQHQAKNYIGIAGCLIALLGMALPYVDAWLLRASLFSLLAEFAAFAIPLVLLALVCAVILCVQGNHQVRWIGVVLLLLLLAITFLDDENIVENVFELLGSGFWVMVIGLIIIILSSSFSLGNILSNTYPTSRPFSKPAASNASSNHALQWTCKRCGRKNTGNGNFCSSCGEQNPTKLFCPSCGKPVAVGDVFCMHCRVNLAEAKRNAAPAEPQKPKEEASAAPVSAEPPKEEEKLSYEGVWQLGVNDKGIPRAELVISRLQEKLFRFELTQNGVYSIHGQVSTLNSQGTSSFRTEDGTVTGMLSFEESKVLLIVDTANFPYLNTGDVLIFPIRSDRRAL